MKSSIINIVLTFIIFISSGPLWASTQTGHPLNSATKQYTLDEIILITKNANYEVRSRAENVYQARKSIQVRLGRLLPSLNFSTIFSILEMDVINVTASLIGFIFPSNWFSWKESRYLYQAEKRSYITLVANQIYTIESLTYKVHQLEMVLRLYYSLVKKIDGILAIAQTRRQMGEDTQDLVLQMENLRLQIRNDERNMKNSLQQIYADLAFGIGLAPAEANKFSLAPIKLPDLSQQDEMKGEELITIALKMSQELKSFHYLIIASHYNRKAKTFDFLTPGGNRDHSLGYGYRSSLKIARSRTRELRAKADEMASEITKTLLQSVQNYNMTLNLFENNYQGLQNALEWNQLMEDKFRQEGEYNALSFTKAIKSMFMFEIKLLENQHQFMIARAQIHRILWLGDHFQSVLNFHPKFKKNRPRLGTRFKRFLRIRPKRYETPFSN